MTAPVASWLALMGVAALLAGPAHGQDAEPAEDRTEAATPDSDDVAAEAAEADEAAEDDELEYEEIDPDIDPGESEIEFGDAADVFVPSEEITADSAISFPADI